MGADNLLSRPVAIKELFPEGCQRNGTTVQPTRITPSDFSSMKQKFLDEARLLASLNHPGIVKVYDFFEENNTAYMVMEYLRGKSLAKLVEERGGALGEQEAVGYILKVCEALDVVHKAGYLHRDIKPENIIVCEDGRVVLIDFGAARAYMAGKTGRMTVILTPGYAPYEQYATMARFGPTLDIYALGATLYYLLTGEVPISAPDRAIGVELKSVREINGRVSRQVEEAVMKAMAMRVEERPQSVEEFIWLLKTLKEIITLKGQDEDSVYGVYLITFSPNGKFLALGKGDGDFESKIEVFEVGSWSKIIDLKEEKDKIPIRRSIHTPIVAFSPDGKFLVAGYQILEVGSWQMVFKFGFNIDESIHSITFSPDGRFLASHNWNDTVDIWEVSSWQKITRLSGYRDYRTHMLAHAYSRITFSPDGKFLASGSWRDTTVKVWEVGSWREVATLRGHGDVVHSVSFSPDGKFLASGSGDTTVKVWEVGSWQEVATLKHERTVNSVAFSPDGKFLASGSGDTTVKVWEVGSWREVATLRGHGDVVHSVSFSPDGKFLASGSKDNTVKVWEVGG
jgi:WD40 repeat protein